MTQPPPPRPRTKPVMASAVWSRVLLGPLCILPALLVLVALVSAAWPITRPTPQSIPFAAARTATSAEINLTAAPPRIEPVSTCDGIDESGSEATNDPNDLRDAAVRRALDFLVGLNPPSGGNMVGVVRFGTVAVQALPLTSVASGAVRIRSVLHAGASMGDTDFSQALRACQRVLAGVTNPVIFLLSDGLPDLGDGQSLASLFAQISRTVRGLHGIPVHVLLTIPGGVPASVIAAWRHTGVRSVTDVGTRTGWRDRVTRELIADLGTTIGLLPHPLGQLDDGHRMLAFTVPAYAPRMTITGFTPSAGPRLTLIDPSGRVATSSSGGIAVLSVDHPQSGLWHVESSEASAATIVQADIAPLQAHLVTPVTDVAIGRPISVTAAVGDGSAVEGSAPLYVGAVVVQGRAAYELQLHRTADGLWHSTADAPATSGAAIEIQLVLKVGADTVLDTTMTRLASVARPYLVADYPVVTAAPGARYGWQLWQGEHRISAAVLGEDPAAAVLVTVGSAGPVRARFEGNGRWSLPVTALRQGQTVSAQLSSRLTNGDVIRDAVSSTPQIVPTELSIRVGRMLLSLLIVAMLLAAAWTGWLATAIRTSLEGHLQVSGSKASRPIRTRAKRWQRFPASSTARRCVVWSQGGRLRERAGVVPWPFGVHASRYDLMASPNGRRARARRSVPRSGARLTIRLRHRVR